MSDQEEPISRSTQRSLDLIRHREETLARYPADDPAVAEWLSQFRGADGKRFLERYAEERASALVDGKTFWDLDQREKAELNNEATERLWEIQQRKLFELQVRWRAEEITLPANQVALCDDFEAWGERITQCPFLSPITAAEVDGYLTYLLSDACTDAESVLDRPHDWQDYERYRRYLLLQAEGEDPDRIRHNAGQNAQPGLAGLAAMLDDFFLAYPAWYAYCDEQAGPPNLVRYLPDLRGEKEEYYTYLGRTGKMPDPYASDDAADEPAAPTPVSAGAAPGPPPLRTLDLEKFAGLADTLVRKFESAELLRFHEAVLHEPAIDPTAPPGAEDAEDYEDYEDDEDPSEGEDNLAEMGTEADRELREIPARLPIEAHADWRIALHNTWLNWRKQRLAAALRAAYTAYEARQLAGTPHPSPYEQSPKSQKLTQKNRKQLRKLILRGRRVAGEPQDFNF